MSNLAPPKPTPLPPPVIAKVTLPNNDDGICNSWFERKKCPRLDRGLPCKFKHPTNVIDTATTVSIANTSPTKRISTSNLIINSPPKSRGRDKKSKEMMTPSLNKNINNSLSLLADKNQFDPISINSSSDDEEEKKTDTNIISSNPIGTREVNLPDSNLLELNNIDINENTNDHNLRLDSPIDMSIIDDINKTSNDIVLDEHVSSNKINCNLYSDNESESSSWGDLDANCTEEEEKDMEKRHQENIKERRESLKNKFKGEAENNMVVGYG